MGEFSVIAFGGVVESPLEGRSAKPRTTGHTMVIDKGLGLSQTSDLLELASPYIDYVKLGFGTAALYPSQLLRAKVSLVRSYGVGIYPGGTFLEVAVTQDALAGYLRRVKEFGFTHVEVSDGTISLTPEERAVAIARARDLGLEVVTEVGKKDGAVLIDPEEALAQIQADLEHGACKVIIEGRESGKGVGIYDEAGRVKKGELEAIVAGLNDPSILMWEAPHKAQQEELLIRFGPDVSLGNIAPAEIMAVEALRCGLRGDTLKEGLRRGLIEDARLYLDTARRSE